MNHDDKLHPLARNYLELQRRSARGYACPLCSEIYHNEPKIWDHALRLHGDSFGDLGSPEKASEARKRFREHALDKAQNKAKADKAPLTTADPHQEHRPPEWTEPSGQGPKNAKQRPTLQTASSQGNTPQRQLEDAGKLIVQQGRAAEREEEPTGERHKHGLIYEFGSPQRPFEGNTTQPMNIAGRDVRDSSPGKSGRVLDPGHHDSYLHDTEYKRPRPSSGMSQPLYDPNTDVKLQKKQQSHRYGRSHELQFSSKVTQPLLQGFGPAVSEGHIGGQCSSPYIPGTPEQPFKEEKDQKHSSRKSSPVDDHPEDLDPEPEMLLQPETRPISHEQLVIEVKGIYAGLVMVEAKCIDIDEKQSNAAQERDPSKRSNLKNDQWQSLIALHKQLLHEHHDFFLASQHPSASPALSRLAAKYSMPARMWRHGIHAFLEVLRHRLPESLEHMLAFIYIAYSMMALLYETVSTFEDTWIECLGDLGRYRMAIEDDEPKDREVWSNVARFWYNKAADKSPKVGRLYHHLAILARPYSVEQLSLYIRSLTCLVPFESARGSIMTLFNPILNGKDAVVRRSTSYEIILIKAHGILFTSEPLQSPERFNTAVRELEKDDFLDNAIRKANNKFKEIGVHAAVSNIAALFEYGTPKLGGSKPVLRLCFDNARRLRDEAMIANNNTHDEALDSRKFNEDLVTGPEDSGLYPSKASMLVISQASRLAFFMLRICLNRPKDRNVYPLVHVYLVFFGAVVGLEEAGRLIEDEVPWDDVCSFLNAVAVEFEIMNTRNPGGARSRLESHDFPGPERQRLPEDFILRGQVYSEWYFPETWFIDAMTADDERSMETASMNESRIGRILWISHHIAFAERWIRYDLEDKSFIPVDYSSKNHTSDDGTRPGWADEDSIMTDNGVNSHTIETMSVTASDSYDSTTEFTPRTVSLAASESCEETTTFSDAPAQMDMQNPSEPPGTGVEKTPDVEEDMEDAPMIDISLGIGDRSMAEPSGIPKRGGVFTSLGTPSNDTYVSDNIRESKAPSGYNDHEDAETYKP